MTLATALVCGAACSTPRPADDLPPVGEPRGDVNVVEQSDSGPIVVLFPGRTAPTDDPNLGILQSAQLIADQVDGSVGVFSFAAFELAHRWVTEQSRSRRTRGEPCRLALVGHSWGAPAAGRLLERCFADGSIDEVTMLVSIDAIEEGSLWVFFGHVPSVLTLEIVFPHRLCLLALTEMPPPDGERFRAHVNYYQIDSPHLSGWVVPTATQNHEVWFDAGHELGHGNLDNYVAFLVAEDVIRSLEPRR